MEVGQCNIRSLNTSSTYIEDLVVKTNIRMLLFTEIWHVDANKKLLSHWRWYKNERLDREGGGAAIVVHPSVKSWPREDLKRDNLESAWCEISIDNRSILIGSVYVRPDDSVAMGILTEQLDLLNSEYSNIILTGDFNAKHQMWFNDKQNKLGVDLANFLLSKEFVILNSEAKTFKNSIIDLTLVKGYHQHISQWEVDESIFVRTDHHMIRFKLKTATQRTSITKWNTNKADWEAYTSSMQEKVLDLLGKATTMDQDELYMNLKACIIESAGNSIPKINVNGKHKSWWDEEMSEKYQEVKRKKNRFKKRSDSARLNSYNDAKKEFQELFKEKQNTHMSNLLESMEGNQAEMW